MIKQKAKVERNDLNGNSVSNRILCSISDAEFQQLQPCLEFVEIPQRRFLHQRSKRLNSAYFINNGVASLIITGKRGRSVEVGVVGCEGLTGMPLVAGVHRPSYSAIMQIEGSAFRLKDEVFESAMKSFSDLRDRVLRYSVIHAMQIAQTAACNRLHDAGQRLARWLLMSRDRIGTDVVRLTHDFMATMLGTDRPSVTIAAAHLQRLGAIEYGRKALRIVNRKLLERATCECYFAVRRYNPAVGL